MENLLVVGAVSLATPVVASAIIAVTSALEKRAPVHTDNPTLERSQ